ncbi:MAG TPA: hypothetical protein VFL59_15220 [Candidatus Nanopelagicales bacterium]|nr:hypothetical protein [Candidatus Nanopelagicales bacterium]
MQHSTLSDERRSFGPSVRRLVVLGTGLLVGVALVAPNAGAAKDSGAPKSSTIYSSIPNPLKGNQPSVGFEATQTAELGDDVVFRAGGRRLTSVTVGLSSWGCGSGSWYGKDCVTTPGATFAVPITLTLYRVGSGATPGTVIASTTQTFAIPYRPSASARCTGDQAGKWWDSSLKACFNGYATTVTFPFDNLVVPDTLVWGVSYNTSTAGPHPIGDADCRASSGGCGYDSLNVLTVAAPFYGESDVTPFVDSRSADSYCDGGPTDVFRHVDDTAAARDCWAGYVPSVAFKAAS